MHRKRRREFMLISNDALHLSDCDDSDEDALFDMDAEDETVLAQNVPTSEHNDPVTVEIVDPNTVLHEPVENNMPFSEFVSVICLNLVFTKQFSNVKRSLIQITLIQIEFTSNIQK